MLSQNGRYFDDRFGKVETAVEGLKAGALIIF
jgi:hypothetical protein